MMSWTPTQLFCLIYWHSLKWAVANFTNMFTQRFYASRSEKRKMVNDLTFNLALLGSMSVKASSKMLMKLTRGVNFINFLCALFLYESLFSSFSLLKVWLWTNFWWNWHQVLRKANARWLRCLLSLNLLDQWFPTRVPRHAM